MCVGLENMACYTELDHEAGIEWLLISCGSGKVPLTLQMLEQISVLLEGFPWERRSYVLHISRCCPQVIIMEFHTQANKHTLTYIHGMLPEQSAE